MKDYLKGYMAGVEAGYLIGLKEAQVKAEVATGFAPGTRNLILERIKDRITQQSAHEKTIEEEQGDVLLAKQMRRKLL